MKLSYVLQTYYVLAMSETVSYQVPDESDSDRTINISFTSENREYDQYFNDQEIMNQEASAGVFIVTDLDGNTCEFTALQAVELPPEPLNDKDALDQIQAGIQVHGWTSFTPNAIVHIIKQTGRNIRD